MASNVINVWKLDRELRAAGIPFHGVAADGRIDFKAEATSQQRTQAEAIVAAHDPDDEDEQNSETSRNTLATNIRVWLGQLQNADTNWDTLTVGQRTDLQRLHNRILFHVLRLLIRRIIG